MEATQKKFIDTLSEFIFRWRLKIPLFFVHLVGFFYVLLAVFFNKKEKPKKPRIIWGPDALINYKYWSAALNEIGYDSKTLVMRHFACHKKEDYDLSLEDFTPKISRPFILRLYKNLAIYKAFVHVLLNADIIQTSFWGGLLSRTPFARCEAFLLHYKNCKIVIIPFGSDAYIYSQVQDKRLLEGLMISYPQFGKNEHKVKKQVDYWLKRADIIMGTQFNDGLSRWDCFVSNALCIDLKDWPLKESFSNADGKKDPVYIAHCPNHKGLKGSEFIENAIMELKEEGLNVEFMLIEGKTNLQLKSLLQNKADILVDALIFTGYGMNALEAMSMGLPVIDQMENPHYAQPQLRYGTWSECPIVSATIETVKEKLRILVQKPKLRKELGHQGRLYVEKYHSYKSCQFLFDRIYRKIWNGENLDINHPFHPLKSEYESPIEKIKPTRI